MEFQLKAIILKKTNINEYDEILEVLSEQGHLQVFCPSTRKPTSKNKLSLLPLNLVSLELIKSKYATLKPRLKRATTIKAFLVKSNLINMANDLLYFFSKIKDTDSLILLDCYEEQLDNLDKNKDTKVLDFILFRLLMIEGIDPKTDGCVECGRLDRLVDFQFHKGGFLCSDHSDKLLGKSNLEALFYLSQSFSDFDLHCGFEEAHLIKRMIIQYLSEVLY
ncbi:recombinational DNA repair protein O [Metamycoplasma arthritidis]|uniref:Recombinational DNA repair protein O n=1 Tax=Metamycoplasma arthritidis (strain 158L3-1) TaxID=243272 RepID=B3PM12_META1|nr:DNA repair protein RecO [Metamycoplasma arthritidis]ACF07064.1 recombinational DNA repair protein O [Metamycoplasma arthritidis 158L3-1]VEU78592.1 recombinational DNA repair protein O [Metamycoplasma arthritidis]